MTPRNQKDSTNSTQLHLSPHEQWFSGGRSQQKGSTQTPPNSTSLCLGGVFDPFNRLRLPQPLKRLRNDY